MARDTGQNAARSLPIEPVAKQGGHPRAGGSLLVKPPLNRSTPPTLLRIMYIMLNAVVSWAENQEKGAGRAK